MQKKQINLSAQQNEDAADLLADMRATADVLNAQWETAVWWTFAAFAVCCVNGVLFKRNIRKARLIK